MPCSVAYLSLVEQSEVSRGIGDYGRLEQIAVARNAENPVGAGPCVDLVIVLRGRIDLPSEAVAESQVWHGLPRILGVIGKLILVITLSKRDEVVCMRILI